MSLQLTDSIGYNGTLTYPAGHLHHLSEDQATALDRLKTLLRDNQCYDVTGISLMPSYTDETMLRFLRARNFVPEDAFRQYHKTANWREEQMIDEWYSAIDLDEYEQTRILYTHWTGRRDKRGIPLYVFDIGSLSAKAIKSCKFRQTSFDTAGKLSPKLRRLFATYEHLTAFVLPLCSAMTDRPNPETPVSQTTCIVDISKVSLTQFWSLKTHLQDASVLASAHYPETLGRTFIVGAPSFFPTVWNWLKGWFDPATVAKVFILPEAEVKETLLAQVEARDLPQLYSGELKWEFGNAPVLEEVITQKLNMQSVLPKGPIRWKENGTNEVIEAHAVGTANGTARDNVFARMSREDFVK